MKKSIFIFLTISIIIIIVEISLRLLGFRPHQRLNFDDIECDGIVWQIPFDSIGYVFNPGEYNCIVNKQIKFKVTQNNDLSRKTSNEEVNCNKRIHFYGDSYIWGQSLNDDQTMAWQVQSKSKEICVKNYGVGAYSSIQSFLLFKENLKNKRYPDEVFLFYSNFLDDRNAFTSSWKNVWQSLLVDLKKSEEFKPQNNQDFYFPIGKVVSDTLKIEYLSEQNINKSLPLRNSLAIMNILDIQINKHKDKQKKPHLVSKELFKKFFALSKKNHIKFTLVLICENSLDSSEIKELRDYGVPVIDISFELNIEEHTFYPADMHPNEKANKIWTKNIFEYLISKNH